MAKIVSLLGLNYLKMVADGYALANRLAFLCVWCYIILKKWWLDILLRFFWLYIP